VKLLLAVLAVVERFLERRRTAGSRRTAAHRQAVVSLLAAVVETEQYASERKEGGRRDRRREAELAKLWATAAVDVRSVDRRLSRIALVKSFSWANPELLTNENYKDVPTQLDLIRNQCEWLLENWE